jgi:sulfur-oxidizing protein SoxY
MKRRTLLKGSLSAGVLGVAAGAGLLTPQMVLAAWPKAAFDAKSVDSAVKTLLGSDSLSASNDITITAPPIAENGAVVNVAVSSTLKNAESISLLVEKNGSPLAASFNLSAQTEPFVKTRIKVAKTSSVIAVVKSGGKLYSAGREVKVTIGGCGG